MSSVTIDIANSVATITLQAPKSRNAINVNMVREMHRVLDQVQKEGSAIRALGSAGAPGSCRYDRLPR